MNYGVIIKILLILTKTLWLQFNNSIGISIKIKIFS